MITETLFCPRCGSTRVIRHGKDANDVQRYRCRACAYTFRENPQPNGYPEEQKAQILAAYQERASLRGLRRIFGARAHDRLGLAQGAGPGASPPGRDASAGRGRGGSGAR